MRDLAAASPLPYRGFTRVSMRRDYIADMCDVRRVVARASRLTWLKRGSGRSAAFETHRGCCTGFSSHHMVSKCSTFLTQIPFFLITDFRLIRATRYVRTRKIHDFSPFLFVYKATIVIVFTK